MSQIGKLNFNEVLSRVQRHLARQNQGVHSNLGLWLPLVLFSHEFRGGHKCFFTVSPAESGA